MYGSDKAPLDDSERTAFRRTEKKYKLYYQSNSKKKKIAKQVDLSDVLDFKSILESHNNDNENVPSGIYAIQSDFDLPVFCLENLPGFYFIPGALSVEEQCRWIKESLVNFPQPPNRTNHNALYGSIDDLFNSAKESKVLIEEERSLGNVDSKEWKFIDQDSVSSRGRACTSIPSSVLLRKLRWSTLGLQFDWSKRNYDVSLPYNEIPNDLCELARTMAVPAMPVGQEFRPEAAIVNYFSSGDTLGGHLDDMEADWSKPIVSMSLGCKAIFLLGGKSREDEPLAMFLRSGDIVLMAGEARERFHGVPRIFADKENAEIQGIESHFSQEEDSCFLEYIRNSRININIRQVF